MPGPYIRSVLDVFTLTLTALSQDKLVYVLRLEDDIRLTTVEAQSRKHRDNTTAVG